MRAIVIASVSVSDWPELLGRHAACLLPLGDRPFLQHVVERLATEGIRKIDVVQFEHPASIEGLLGDGTRWGLEIRHHLASESVGVLDRCRVVASCLDPGPVLFVQGDRIVLDEVLAHGAKPPAAPVSFVYQAEDAANASEERWTGWAWLPSSLIAELPIGLGRAEAEAWLSERARASGRSQAVGRPLAAYPLDELLASQRRLLMGEAPGLQLDGREGARGVRLSRASSVADSSELEAPILVGEGARIGRGAQVGPNVVLGDRSFIGPNARLRNALVLPDSYVGESISLTEAIVDRGLIAHVEVGAELTIREEAIAAGLSKRDPLQPARLGSRLAALLGLALGWPLLLLAAGWIGLRGGRPLFRRRSVVQLPATRDPAGWRSFSLASLVADGESSQAEGLDGLADLPLRLLPGLLSVLRGELSLVGIRPRTATELKNLPEHWRALCLSARAGLISEALVQHGPHATRAEAFAAECLQVASTTPMKRMGLVLRYLGWLGGRRPGTGAQSADDSAGGTM